MIEVEWFNNFYTCPAAGVNIIIWNTHLFYFIARFKRSEPSKPQSPPILKSTPAKEPHLIALLGGTEV